MVLKYYVELTRFVLSFAIASSAVAGYMIHNHSFDKNCLYVFLGVLFFSSLASVINAYQERRIDELMERTKSRAIAFKQIKKKDLIIFSLLLFLGGSFFLIKTAYAFALLFAIFNVVWYNMVYTPLKKKTVYSIIAGGVTGAIPTVIGWIAAGGSIFENRIIVIAVFMFLWQIPHFWFLLVKNATDYQKAGLKISLILHNENIRLVIFYWVLSTVLCSSIFPAFNIISNKILIISMMIVNIWILMFFYKKLFGKAVIKSTKAYVSPFYLYQAFILIIVIIDSIEKPVNL